MWAGDPWKALSPATVGNVRHIGYAAAAGLIGIAVLAYERRWSATVGHDHTAAAMIVSIRFFDLTQAAAHRYYLAAPLIALVVDWPRTTIRFFALAR
jgi:hypothetical protein